MKLVNGTQLTEPARREALASFVHRYTGDHTPAWARFPRPDGTAYPVQFRSDAEWLANTEFWVTKHGRLAGGRVCHSTPTWPNGREIQT